MDTTDFLIEQFTSPGKLVGHLSYMLLVGSMLMRSMTWLRIIAVSAGVVSAIYGFFWLKDFVTVFWEVVFVTVNLVQLLLLELQNRRARFNKDEEQFIAAVIPNVEKAHARRLLRQADHIDLEPDDVLTIEGEPVDRLLFVLDGSVRIERGGAMVGVCGRNDFVGEMAFMSGNGATATAIVTHPSRALAFDRDVLKKALGRDESLRHEMSTSFNRNLVDKLVKSNVGQAEAGQPYVAQADSEAHENRS